MNEVSGGMPDDWAELQWHRAPGRARYHSKPKAERACRWLNANPHAEDVWLVRVGGYEATTGRWCLDRRWIGHDDGVIGASPETAGESPTGPPPHEGPAAT
jgi:hypothetical protein